MEERIRKAISKALAQIGAPETKFVVERLDDMSRGDYSTNAAMTVAKSIGGAIKIAEKLKLILEEELDDLVEKMEVAGPGFVNITLARDAVTFVIAEAGAQGAEWGKGSARENERVMIEYTDPNPFKEMHIGHLMSNVIGEALARLIENEGATVIRCLLYTSPSPRD